MTQRSIRVQRDMEGIIPPVRARLDSTNKGYNKPAKSDIPTDPYDFDVIHVVSGKLRTEGIHRVTIPLVKVDTRNHDYNDLERQLKSIPNIREWEDTTQFSWTHRSLIRLPARELGIGGTTWSYDYLMYICLDPTSTLPRNKYLESLGGYSEVPGVPVYGDAFIFSMKPWLDESDASRVAKWVHMTDHFAEGARRHVGQEIPKLLRSLPKPEKDDEKK